jgi:hypothetical protein
VDPAASTASAKNMSLARRLRPSRPLGAHEWVVGAEIHGEGHLVEQRRGVVVDRHRLVDRGGRGAP